MLICSKADWLDILIGIEHNPIEAMVMTMDEMVFSNKTEFETAEEVLYSF